MVPVKRLNGTTVQYKIEFIPRYQIKRVTSTEDASIHEDILQAAHIGDARQTAKALTDYERAHPEDAYTKVVDFGDVEIH